MAALIPKTDLAATLRNSHCVWTASRSGANEMLQLPCPCVALLNGCLVLLLPFPIEATTEGDDSPKQRQGDRSPHQQPIAVNEENWYPRRQQDQKDIQPETLPLVICLELPGILMEGGRGALHLLRMPRDDIQLRVALGHGTHVFPHLRHSIIDLSLHLG